MVDKGVYLTIKESVILHLYCMEITSGSRYWNTQNGIATAIFKRQDQTSQALTQLEAEGLVSSDKVHVEQMGRKRKIYVLEDRGRDIGKELLKNMVNSAYFMEFGGAKNLLEKYGTGVALSAAIYIIYKNGRLETPLLESMIKNLRRAENMGLTHGAESYLENAPRVEFFVGRRTELESLRRWIEDNSSPLIVIYGIPGIGKTTLASKLVRDYEGIYNIAWFRIHPWDNARSILENLSLFLTNIGGAALKEYIQSKRPLGHEQIEELIVKDLRDSYTIIVFDDFQRLDPKLLPTFSSIARAVVHSGSTTMITVGRQVVPFYSGKEENTAVRRIQLEGLNMDASRAIMRKRIMSDEEFRELYRVTKGHPLFLELLDTGEQQFSTHPDIRKYLYEEVLMKLENAEREVLGRISVYRYPVGTKALFPSGNVDYSILEGLLSRAMIQRLDVDVFDIHDVLREFFYSTLTPQQREKMHLDAARYYLDNPGDLEIIESIYHLIKGRDLKTGAHHLLESAEELTKKGFADRVIELIEYIPMKALPDELWPRIYLEKGRALMQLGELDSALGNLYQVLILGERTGSRKAIGNALMMIANIRRIRGETQKAMDNLKESFEIFQSLGDDSGMTHALRSMALIFIDSGKLEAALDHLQEAKRSAEASGDRVLQAQVFTDLGTVYVNYGNLEMASGYLESAIDIFESLGHHYESIDAFLMLGIISAARKEFQTAAERFDRCIELAEMTGNTRATGMAMAYLGDMFISMGNLEQAMMNLNYAEEIFNRIGDVSMEKRVMRSKERIYSLNG